MKQFINWLISALAVVITAYILPGVMVENIFIALVVAVVLALINTFIKPILVVLTLPISLVTMGLFLFVLNALLVMLAGVVVPGFEVANFWWALLFSIVLWLVNTVFKGFQKEEPQNGRKKVENLSQ